MRGKKSKRFISYDETRKQLLLEDNINEEKAINQLTKRLKIKRKDSTNPLWIHQCGFDYLLDFEKDLHDPASQKQSAGVLGEIGGKKKSVDLYGQTNNSTEADNKAKTLRKKRKIVASEADSPFEGDALTGIESTPEMSLTDSSTILRRTIRGWLNRLSEAHMQRVIMELTSLFTEHPRAVVRTVLIEELGVILEASPIDPHSNTGWLHQELAVCVACIHASLHTKLQHDNLIAQLTESLLDKLFPEHNLLDSSNVVASIALFLAYLFRFGGNNLSCAKAAHVVCTAVGVNLRKANISLTHELVDLATKRLIALNAQRMDEICELEGIIQLLSAKHSKEECVVRATRLKKMMHSWVKGGTFTEGMCLSVSLDDFRRGESKGRWWLVGSARQNETDCPPLRGLEQSDSSLRHDSEADQLRLSPEVETAAATLGLKTVARRTLLNILLSTPGGPEATANALAATCRERSQEREMIQIVLHCLMAEEPFNRFYARVLGSFLSSHRKFLMMVKCAFWDVMKKVDLSVNAKANAGRALGLLASVYDLPLTVLKNFNFGDKSDGNISFLRHVFVELCTGEYQKVLTKLSQLNCYTRLCHNCRIFMRKHFGSDPNENLKAFIMKLVSDLRETELHDVITFVQ
ncbi:unnamed protein product [Dicrocoelium dendriticum]|nr:unnamed protein product [Dicrocoelium dendriticum]